MNTPAWRDGAGRRLLRFGMGLFLLGLLVGFAVPAFANPRMGLASHLEGVMNGLFLIAVGILWPRLRLSERALRATYGLVLFGGYANLAATGLAAAWGAGGMMAIAAQGRSGTPPQEAVIQALLVALSIAMVVASVLIIVGLRGDRDPDAPPGP